MKFFVKTVSCTPHATMSQSLMYAMYYYVHYTLLVFIDFEQTYVNTGSKTQNVKPRFDIQ